ncbi:MAG TPA: pyridoxamine 5'-phosphate oxidase family protein [Nocardia sp.]|uniref:pyridoxamine 5'-phosphate oxidase family protein n=1 Tax=Nocardia sp. TaxID=1821 RepID=UPI002B4AD09C|nr:pyridoxamine 5'-phosphate oxidase family protein [Nocardia sp.]HLS77559.1 pyridoxamine 5'-phosphate oxidase family protein [Nocardia sp.]
MPLNREEREQFLSQPHVAALSVAVPGRGPLVVPIWYQYRPGGLPWVLTGPDSTKMRHIREAGRFSLMVHQESPAVRYVSVEGPLAEVTPVTDAQHLEMVARYLPPEKVEPYLRMAEGFGPQVVVSMRPEHWLSADLGQL